MSIFKWPAITYNTLNLAEIFEMKLSDNSEFNKYTSKLYLFYEYETSSTTYILVTRVFIVNPWVRHVVQNFELC